MKMPNGCSRSILRCILETGGGPYRYVSSNFDLFKSLCVVPDIT